MESDNILASEMTSTPVLIGKWTFYADILQLERGDQRIKLEPRAAYLLYYLAKKAGSPVSRDDLMAEVWPNMIVGDEALTSAINKLRNAFEDDSHHPEVIETIPKVGYRLIADVEFLLSKSNINDPARAKNTILTGPTGNRRAQIAVSIVLIVLVAITINVLWFSLGQENQEQDQSISESSLSDKPSIAVLPFENLSADLNQKYFVDGITEDIITDLSRIKKLIVLARNSSFRYKGQALDLEQITKDLRVSHILEGSVRRSGNNLRITARLIDSSNGQNIWAERFDRQLDDVFKVQDDVTQRIVSSLSIQLTKQDKEVLTQPTTSSFAAYDLFLQGQSLSNERTKEANLQAQKAYQKAIGLDPGYARAYGALAVTLIRFSASGYSDSPEETKKQALKHALKAVKLDSKSQNTFWALGFTYLHHLEYEMAAEAVRAAMVIAPSYADGLALLALINNRVGQAEESIKLIDRAILLNPYFSWDYLYNLGWAHYTLENYVKASEFLQKALERNENARPPRLLLAASYVGLGRLEDAEWEIEEILLQQPKMTLTFLIREIPFADEKKMNIYVSHLRQAGLPE